MSQQGYIGRNPGDGRTIVNRQTSHVTTGLQTSFTMTAGYEIGYLDVYLNGIKQTETLDYTASDGSTINFSLSYPPVNGDVLEFVAFETLNITNIKSARRNFTVGQDLDVSGNVTIGSSLTVASDLVVNGTFTTINTEILDVEDKTVGIASTSSPSNTTADGAGIVIYGGSDGDKSLTWNSTKSNFVLVGGGVSIGTGVTISTPAANVLAFSVNSAEKARFNNFGAFTVGYEGEAWHESTYVGVLQAGSGAWIGQTPGASARAEWTNNAYYDAVNTRWEYIAADEANRIVLENGELKVQSADAGSADGAITWNEKLKMTVGGDFKIGAPTGIGITISSSGNVDSIGIVTASSFVGNGANLTSLNASNIGSGTVPTARLGSGTASSSTFLRGDSTFAAVTSTTISNNADNRLITGTGTANTINAEAELTFDGTSLKLTDHKNIYLGTGNDLRIWHDANNSYSQISGQNYSLYIDGATTYMRTSDGSSGVENAIVMNSNSSVDLYHSGTKKFETTSAGVSVSGNLAVSGTSALSGNVSLPDASAVQFGAGTDMEIYHIADTINVIRGSGPLTIQTDDTATGIKLSTYSGGENLALFKKNGACELYYDNVKTFSTIGNGIRVEGTEGATGIFELYADEGDDNGDKWRFVAETDGTLNLQDYGAGSWYNNIRFTGNTGGVILFQNNDAKFQTQSDGVRVEDGGRLYLQNDSENAASAIQNNAGSGSSNIEFRTGGTHRVTISATGMLEPALNNTYDLGTTSLRWRNIYTNDLNLSNKGSSNDVDGTWGDYTIQEGESDLFLINKRSGKKFKFMLQEVS